MTAPTSESRSTGGVPRRSFLKWSSAAGGAAALATTGAHYGVLPGLRAANAAETTGGPDIDRTVWSSCNVNCGSRCPLRMQVRDGQIVRILQDNTGSDELGDQQIRACVRGRAIRQRIYNPDRLKAPMKRVGPRGSGEFEEITWDEAFDLVASELKRVIKTYGNEAIHNLYGSGTAGANMNNGSTWERLTNLLGGSLGYYGTYSTSQIRAGTPYTYGSYVTGNTFNDTVNTELLVLWGNNPLETRMSGGGETFVLQQAKKKAGFKVIVVDPRYSDTAVDLADEWIALRPGTDAALVAGLAHVMISEGLHDQKFLDTYCVGFDEEHMPKGAAPHASYKSYIMGLGRDGIEKTPQWAAAISGVPAATIRRFAREIGGAKPCAIVQGWGPQRQANGENNARAIFMPAILTGNVGIAGGGTGAREGTFKLPLAFFPSGENPVKTAISCFTWTDAVERGSEMTALADGVRGKDKLDVGIKLIIAHASNTLINQHSDTGRTAKLLKDEKKCEFIVVVENHMTASAKFADILLPDVTNPEQPDLIPGGYAGDMGYVIYADQVIEPLYKCKTTYEMCTQIAKRLGLEEKFTEGRTQVEWIDKLLAETREKVPDLPSHADLKKMGVYRQVNPDGNFVSLKSFRENPVKNPLKTPSGKIEIYSAAVQEIADTWKLPKGDKITALPEYVATWEGAEDARANMKHPLQMIGHHYKARTHSSYGNVEWLKEAHPQMMWINTLDAQARGIASDETVAVFNDRGRIHLKARVTPRIAPGVISVPQGAWYSPNAQGIDVGGNINTLTSWHPSPLAKGNPQHTNLVQVEKA